MTAPKDFLDYIVQDMQAWSMRTCRWCMGTRTTGYKSIYHQIN